MESTGSTERFRLAVGLAPGRSFLLFAVMIAVAALFAVVFVCSIEIAAALAIVSATAVALFLRPVVAVYLVLLTAPLLNIGFKYDNPLRIVNEFMPFVVVPVAAMAAAYLLRRAANPRRAFNQASGKGSDRHAYLVNFAMLSFLGLSAASLFWTDDFVHGRQMFLITALFFAVMKLFPEVITRRGQIGNIVKVFPVVAIGLMALLILSEDYYDYVKEIMITDDLSLVFLFHTIGSGEGKIRLGGFAPVNIAANILTMTIFANIAIAYRYGWKTRAVLALHSLFLLFGIFKTGSKAGLVSLMVGLFSLPVIIPELRGRFIRIAGVILGLMGVILIAAGELILKRFEAMLTGEDTFITDRLGWWSKGFSFLYDSFGAGLGAGGFPRLIDPVPAAHSFYFSALFEYGPAGLALLFIIFATVISRAVKAAPSVEPAWLRFTLYCLLGELITLMLHGLLDFEFTYVIFWVLLGLILSIVGISEAERAAEGPPGL
jgi:hypothetical protein